MTRNFSDLNSEKHVLSAMAYKDEWLCYGIENLKESDFSTIQTRIIYKALLGMYKENESPSVEKALIWLKKIGGVELIGSLSMAMDYLGMLALPSDVEYFAKIVKNLSIYRKIEEAVSKINCELDQVAIMEGSALLEYSRDLLHKIDDSMDGELGVDFRKDYDEKTEQELIKKSEFYREHGFPEMVPGILTSHVEMDKILDGFGTSQLIVIAARPSMGKTAFAIDLAANVAKNRNPVYFFSIEMTYGEIKERLISNVSGIAMQKIRYGDLLEHEVTAVSKAVRMIDENKLVVNDKSGIKISEIMSKIRRAKEKFGIATVFIDYLQYIKSDKPAEYRYMELGDITRSLKTLAKEIQIPIVVLAQLSRKVDERPTHKPLLSDLKESGSIEQDSDVVLSLYRPDFYDSYDHPGELVIQVLKNRRGSTAEIRMKFHKDFCKFDDIPKF